VREAVELLSSMRFAISLLTLICIASVIGTVVKQHEPYNNYVNQFGPFWAEVFGRVGLYAVYSAWWFLLILAFLVTSTSAVHRAQHAQDPGRPEGYKEHARAACRPFTTRPRPRWRCEAARGALGQNAGQRRLEGPLQQRAPGTATAGWWRQGRRSQQDRLHRRAQAIVLVCLGGLLDGDLIVRAQMLFNGKTPYTGGGMISRRAGEHRLSSATPPSAATCWWPKARSRHGHPEPVRRRPAAGAAVRVELKKFIVEYYATGMPKLFASEIVIHDKETGEKIPATVRSTTRPSPRHRDLPVQLRRRRLGR
jgi:cytochrome c biogenesis protein